MLKFINRYNRLLAFCILAAFILVCILSNTNDIKHLVKFIAYFAAPFYLCLSFLWLPGRIINLKPAKRRSFAAYLFTTLGVVSFVVMLVFWLFDPNLIAPEILMCPLGILSAGIVYASKCS